MKPSEDLFDLIHSLTHGEKWHFKVYTGKHFNQSGKNYIRLFEAIEGQKEYNEDAIKKRFRKEKFVKQLSVTKTYLYGQIMESLDVFHARNTALLKVKQQLRYLQILYNKRLYSQAEKVLRKSRKMIDMYEMPLPMLDLRQWELKLASVPGKRQEEFLMEREVEEEKAIAQYRDTAAYERLIRRLVLYINRFGTPRSAADMKRFLPIMKHPLIKDEHRATTAQARMYVAGIKAFYLAMSGDLESAYKYYLQVVYLMDNHREKLAPEEDTYHNLYTTHLYNFLSIAINLRRFDELFDEKLSQLKKLGELGATNKEQQLSVLEINSRMHYYAAQAQRFADLAAYKEGEQLDPLVRKDLKKYFPGAPSLIVTDIYINMGVLYFSKADFDNALYWYAQFMNHPQAANRQEIYGWVKIMLVVIHLELGNMEVLESAFKSAYHFLSKEERLYQSEKLILRFFRKEIPRIYDEASFLNALQKLHGSLQKLTRSPFEAKVLHQFRLLLWLQSRIEKRPVQEVFKETLDKL